MFKTLAILALMALPLSAQTMKMGVTLGADANDGLGGTVCGIAFVQFYLNGTAIGPQIPPPATGNHYSTVWDSKSVANGPYTLTAKATDKAGPNGTCDGSKPNIGVSSPITINVLNIPDDVTPPVITLTPPLSGAVITSKQQSIQVAAADESPISTITLKVNGVVQATTTNQNTLGFVWNTNPYKGRSAVIEVAATDEAGNTSTTTSMVTVKK